MFMTVTPPCGAPKAVIASMVNCRAVEGKAAVKQSVKRPAASETAFEGEAAVKQPAKRAAAVKQPVAPPQAAPQAAREMDPFIMNMDLPDDF